MTGHTENDGKVELLPQARMENVTESKEAGRGDEILPQVLCSGCGQVGQVVRFTRSETDTVRDLKFQVTKVLRRCNACGMEFENSSDPDWRKDAYDRYRSAKGMVSPTEVIAWRVRVGLSPGQAAERLGLPALTLNRYENGALQTDEHDQVLAAAVRAQE